MIGNHIGAPIGGVLGGGANDIIVAATEVVDSVVFAVRSSQAIDTVVPSIISGRGIGVSSAGSGLIGGITSGYGRSGSVSAGSGQRSGISAGSGRATTRRD